jgi:predicted HicB family RNase H-like nuclease
MKKLMSLRMPLELHERLVKLAAQEKRSLHNMILLLLDEAIAARQAKKEG